MSKQPEFPTSLPVVGRREIAMRTGMLVQNVDRMIRDSPDFPPTVAEPSAGQGKVFRLWWWPAVRQWLIDNDKPYDAGYTLDDINPHRHVLTERKRFTSRTRSD